MEATWVDEQMKDEQNTVNTYNVMLFSLTKDWNSDMILKLEDIILWICQKDKYRVILFYMKSSRAWVANLQNLMPNDLRWSWCKHNRNKMHNKCNLRESSQNHSDTPTLVHRKLLSTKPIPGTKS